VSSDDSVNLASGQSTWPSTCGFSIGFQVLPWNQGRRGQAEEERHYAWASEGHSGFHATEVAARQLSLARHRPRWVTRTERRLARCRRRRHGPSSGSQPRAGSAGVVRKRYCA
jgi:hypothetical protein